MVIRMVKKGQISVVISVVKKRHFWIINSVV